MRKLSLKLDELAVDSFDTGAMGGTRGTVAGNWGSYPTTMNVNEMCSAGCTDYCETNDGMGGGSTCDTRCYTRNYPGCLSAEGISCVPAQC
ncbi:MAG TPA: hypothetical protein VGO40_22430 [Longimicrobium sp.]|nr:hypothetical protein [Longimicrobium sp.]